MRITDAMSAPILQVQGQGSFALVILGKRIHRGISRRRKRELRCWRELEDSGDQCANYEWIYAPAIGSIRV